jgi:hypothetical protein
MKLCRNRRNKSRKGRKMAEFLTREEIKDYYNRLLNKPLYIKTLKKSINEVKVEQILSYAREVYMESIVRLERENGFFQPVAPYNFPPCPLFTDVFVLPNGIKLDAFTYQDQLKYWLSTSKKVIQILEENMKPGRQKIIPTQDLRLGDVLIKSESAEQVKSYYKFEKHSYTYLAKFLRILQSMGYFKRKLTSPEFQSIGRNDFDDVTFNDRNDYKPPELKDLHKYPDFRDIPEPGKS